VCECSDRIGGGEVDADAAGAGRQEEQEAVTARGSFHLRVEVVARGCREQN